MICPCCGKEIPDSLVIMRARELRKSKVTTAKREASARNGKLGGRPRKNKEITE